MIELYQKESCPNSAKVRKKLDQLELDYVVHSMPDGSKKREFLKTIGGKEQVPFLVDIDHGAALYETEDIIQYLEGTYSSAEQRMTATDHRPPARKGWQRRRG